METIKNSHDTDMDGIAAALGGFQSPDTPKVEASAVLSEVKPEHDKTATNFWKASAKQVVTNDYDVVPIKHKEKRPFIKGWPGTDFTTPKQIDTYGKTLNGIGIKTATTPAIDIDVHRSHVVKQIVTMIHGELSGTGTLLTRTGKKPKTLIPCRLGGGLFRKLKTVAFIDPNDPTETKQVVEILGNGQQFVSHGIHPDIDQEYKWGSGKSPINTPRSKLPELTVKKATLIIKKTEQIFRDAGFFEVAGGNKASTNNLVCNDVDVSAINPQAAALVAGALDLDYVPNDLAMPSKVIPQFDDEEAARLEHAISNIDFSKFDYDAGIPIIAGLKRGSFGDERVLKALHGQASKDNKRGSAGYSADYIDSTWKSISIVNTATDNEATLGVVYRTAIEHGWDEVDYDASVARNKIGNGVVLAFDKPISPGEFPHATKTEKGGYNRTVKCTIENVSHLLARYGISARFDVITKQHRFTGNGMPDDSRTGGAALAVNARLESLATLCGIAPTNMQKMANNISMDNPVNPVTDYISGLNWDGKDHIKKLAACIGVDKADKSMRNEILRLFIIEACAAADWAEKTPNKTAKAKFEYIPTLYSGQGVQKTKFWNELLPKPLRKYFADGLHLDPSNVDSVREATSNWLVELGELDSTVRAGDISRLKAFASKGIDTYRTPYDRVAGSYQRRTVMCGSVNLCDFLRDRTGSRRFWPLEVQNITLPSVAGVELVQVWAQGWTLYASGHQWWPTAQFEAVLDKYRARFSTDDVFGIGVAMAKYFEPLTLANKAKTGSKRMAVSEIHAVLFPQEFTPSRSNLTAISHYLQQHNKDAHGGVDRKNHQGTHKWLMPPPK